MTRFARIFMFAIAAVGLASGVALLVLAGHVAGHGRPVEALDGIAKVFAVLGGGSRLVAL